MIGNYLKVAIRNFIKHKVYVIINILGLGFGIGCSIVAYVNWDNDNSFDKNYIGAENVYKINTLRYVNDHAVEYSVSPLALHHAVQNKITGINATATIMVKQEVFKKEEEVWYSKVGYVSASFFDMFTFEVLEGSLNKFKSQQGVIITQSTVLKYFHEKHVVGEQLQLSASDGQLHDYIVIAVVADPPTNSSFTMEMYLPIEQFEVVNHTSLVDWSEIAHAFFIKKAKGTSTESLLEQLNPLAALFNAKREDWQIEEFTLVPFYSMAQHASTTKGNYLAQANPKGSVMVPTIMAALILLIGCFNFTNTSLALSEKRLKEMGVRKSLGGQRSELIIQVLSENAMLCFFALVLGILLAELLVPAYNQMGPWVNNTLSYQDNLPLFGFLIALLTIVVLVSSAYPAFYVAGLNAAHILKGTVKYKNINWITKVLIVLQLSISLSTLIQGAGYLENAFYQQQFDYGFDKDGVITIPLKDGFAFDQLNNKLSQNAAIISIAGSTHHIGAKYSRKMIEYQSTKREMDVYEIGSNYFKTNGLILDEGRLLRDSEADRGFTIVVNKAFINDWNLDNPIGTKIRIDDSVLEIVGIVNDFYPNGLWIGQQAKPTIFQLANKDSYQYLTANVDASSSLSINEEIKASWKMLFPYQPYEGTIENEAIFQTNLLNRNIVVLNLILAVMALLLSGIGLYNMVAMNVLKQRKALGVRKVLGASVYQLFINLSKPTIILLLISTVIGILNGYFLTGMVLKLMYSFYVLPSAITLTGSAIVILVILLSVISIKIYNEAKNNPIEALHYE